MTTALAAGGSPSGLRSDVAARRRCLPRKPIFIEIATYCSLSYRAAGRSPIAGDILEIGTGHPWLPCERCHGLRRPAARRRRQWRRGNRRLW
jgi:hypothetical protein